MKNMTIFLDTNIVIDYLQNREPFVNYARSIFELCANGKISASISSQSIADIFYILRKDYTVSERKNMLLNICVIFNVVGADKTIVMNALINEDFNDLEDCIQSECANTANAEYIITRNVEHFKFSAINPILPEDFLKLLNE